MTSPCAKSRGNGTGWRGRAVEPLVREALAPLLPDANLRAAPVIGTYRTPADDVEIDMVGADRAPIAEEPLFVGSVKGLENAPFDRRDLSALLRHRAALTPDPVAVVALSRSGTDCPGPAAEDGPEDLLGAWPA